MGCTQVRHFKCYGFFCGFKEKAVAVVPMRAVVAQWVALEAWAAAGRQRQQPLLVWADCLREGCQRYGKLETDHPALTPTRGQQTEVE